MERSKYGRPHLHLRLRLPFCPGLMPNFMSRIRLPLFVPVRQLGLPLDLLATTLRNRLKVLFLRFRTQRCLPPVGWVAEEDCGGAAANCDVSAADGSGGWYWKGIRGMEQET
jgi:hypothetical protein